MTEHLSVLSLNIGNPSIERAKRQVAWLNSRTEDVFVLTECKNNLGCHYIEEYFSKPRFDLFNMAYLPRYDVLFPKSETKELGVMIISKYPIVSHNSAFDNNSMYYSRIIDANIQVNNFLVNIMGLYVPSRDRSDLKINRKHEFIEGIQQYLKNKKSRNSIVCGDFNVLERNHIPHYSTFFEWEYQFYDFLQDNNYDDIYRHFFPDEKEYSWVGRSNDGYRYDHCFVSSDLINSITACYYDHSTRQTTLTDHSAIVLNMDLI